MRVNLTEPSRGVAQELRQTEVALRNLRREESCERDQPGEPETEREAKWQEAHSRAFTRIVPVRASRHSPRRLPLRSPSPGRPERVLPAQEVYGAELTCW